MARNYKLLPKQRLEAFSDGVLAIVITLLVLDLKVPTDSKDLGAALLAEWRVYLSYLVSFAFVGGWWVAHSNLTRFLRSGNGAFFRLNLLALLFVSVTPFTTSLMGEHSGDASARVATIVFGDQPPAGLPRAQHARTVSRGATGRWSKTRWPKMTFAPSCGGGGGRWACSPSPLPSPWSHRRPPLFSISPARSSSLWSLLSPAGRKEGMRPKRPLRQPNRTQRMDIDAISIPT